MPEWIVSMILSFLMCGGSWRKNAPGCDCYCGCEFNEEHESDDDETDERDS